MAVTFYYAPRSSSSRVHWAIEELGIAHEKVHVDIRKGESRKAEYLAINPHGKVPALVDGDTKLFESMAILFYLGERYGAEKGLWPGEAALGKRGEAMAWSIWALVELQLLAFQWIMHASDAPFALPPEKRNQEVAEKSRAGWSKQLAVLEGHMKDRKFVLGDTFTLADVACAAVVNLGVSYGKLPITDFPHVTAWLATCTSRPAFARIQ